MLFADREFRIGVSWTKFVVMKSALDISLSFHRAINLQGLFNGQLEHMEYLNL